MKPAKYAAKRLNRENQTISIITNERDGANRHLTTIQPTTQQQQQQQAALYERDRQTQVKTYTDHGNGHGLRSMGTTHYSKVSFFFSSSLFFGLTVFIFFFLKDSLYLSFFSSSSNSFSSFDETLIYSDSSCFSIYQYTKNSNEFIFSD